MPSSSASTNLDFGGNTTLGNAATPLNQNIASGFVFGNLTFDATAGAFFIGGSDAFDPTGGGTIIQSSSSAESIANAFTAGGTATLTMAGNGTGVVTLSGTMTGDNGGHKMSFVKNGTSTYFLNNASASTINSTTINGGILEIGATDSLGGSAVTVNSGGTFEIGNITSANSAPTIYSGGTLMGAGTLAVQSVAVALDTTAGSTFTLSSGASASNLLNLTGGVTGSSSTSTLTITGTGTVELSATASYVGNTSVSSGAAFRLDTGGTLANTAVTVAGNATFAPDSATSLAGNLTLQTNAIFDMTTDGPGSNGNFTITGTGTALTLQGAALKFDLGNSTADRLTVSTGAASVTGNNTISLNTTGDGSLTAGNYTLISAASGLGNNFVLANNSATIGSSTYNLSLSGNATVEQLRVTVADASHFTATPSTLTLNSFINGNATGNFTLTSSVAGSYTTGIAQGGNGTLSITSGGNGTSVTSATVNLATGTLSAVGTGLNVGAINVTDTGNFSGGTAVSITANVYNHAAGNISGSTLTIPTVIVGYSGNVTSNALTITNTAANPGGALNITGTSGISGVTLNNPSNITAGNGTGSLTATLGNGQGIGSFSGNTTITYADASSYAGANSNLATATLTITGDVLGHASGVLSVGNMTGNLTSGDAFVNATVNVPLSITNAANSANLVVSSITGGENITGEITSGNITAGGNATGIDSLTTSTAGNVSLNYTLYYGDQQNLTGHNAAGSQSTSAAASVLHLFDHANPQLGAGNATGASLTLNLGRVTQTDTIHGNYTIANAIGNSAQRDGLTVTSITANNNGFASGATTFGNLAASASNVYTASYTPSTATGNQSQTFTYTTQDADNFGNLRQTGSVLLTITATADALVEHVDASTLVDTGNPATTPTAFYRRNSTYGGNNLGSVTVTKTLAGNYLPGYDNNIGNGTGVDHGTLTVNVTGANGQFAPDTSTVLLGFTNVNHNNPSSEANLSELESALTAAGISWKDFLGGTHSNNWPSLSVGSDPLSGTGVYQAVADYDLELAFNGPASSTGQSYFDFNFAGDLASSGDVVNIAVIPEPGSLALLMLGGFPLVFRPARKRR